jgi:hypothetical protein
LAWYIDFPDYSSVALRINPAFLIAGLIINQIKKARQWRKHPIAGRVNDYCETVAVLP